jgi:SAM-dependent methyltransferase
VTSWRALSGKAGSRPAESARCRIDAVSIRPSVSAQRDATQGVLAQSPPERWEFNFVRDPLVRYLRDRRLEIALSLLSREGLGPRDFGSSLVVCGGVGGEGVFLLRRGFENVTLSDIAPAALDVCPEPRLARRVLNAEEMRDLADGSFDLVLVQDGLHHLPRPTLGFTEMLRVARRAVIVIEPHASLVGKIIGTTWERHGDALNYVFRWNGKLFTDLTRSYLGQRCATTVARVWDHNVSVNRVASKMPRPLRLPVAKAIYAALTPFNSVGNMMIGVALKS